MLRRLAWITSPLLVALLASSCLYTTHTEKKVQRIRISSDPSRAYVWQIEDGQKKALGYTATAWSVAAE